MGPLSALPGTRRLSGTWACVFREPKCLAVGGSREKQQQKEEEEEEEEDAIDTKPPGPAPMD